MDNSLDYTIAVKCCFHIFLSNWQPSGQETYGASFKIQSISKGRAKHSHQLLLCNHFVNHISWPSIHFLKALLDLHKRRTTNWVMMPALLHQCSQDRWHVARNPRAFPASCIGRLNGVCNCLQYLLDALTCTYPVIVGIGRACWHAVHGFAMQNTYRVK